MGKSRKDGSKNEEVVYAKKKGKSKVIYVDDRDYNNASAKGKRHVSGKRLKKSVKGKIKVRYVYVSEDSESDGHEIVVKKRSKHKVVRRSRDVSDSEGDDSSSYEVVKKRKKHPKKVEYETETSTKSDDSGAEEVVVKKRKKRNCEVNEGTRKRKKVAKKLKKANGEGSSVDMLPCNDGAVMSVPSDTCYRSHVGGAMDKLSCLEFSEAHLDAIKQTPFWYMFDSIYKKESDKFLKMSHKYEADFRKIVETYDTVAKKFSIGGSMVSITSTDVELIFGVSCGDVEIELLADGYTHPPWLVRCFKERIKDKKVKFVMYRNLIYLKIVELLDSKDKESIEDVARLVHCFLLASIFAPLQSGAIRWQITSFLSDFPTICSFDWSRYIVGVLKDQLLSSTNMRCGGCTNILPYWLCEHTNIIKRESEVAFPRFLNWDLSELHKVLDEVELGGLPSVSTARLSITEPEMRHLLDLKLYRSSLQVRKDPTNLDGEVAGPSNRLEGEECAEEMATAPASEGITFAAPNLNEEHPSPLEGSCRNVSGESQNMTYDIGGPLFSIGMTQYGTDIGDDAGIGSPFSDHVVVYPDSNECPESINKMSSANTENCQADDPHLTEEVAELKLQIEDLIKERETEAVVLRQMRQETADLRSANQELARKLLVFEEGPSATQLYENPAVMAQLESAEQIAILKEEKKNLMLFVADLTQKLLNRTSPVKPDCQPEILETDSTLESHRNENLDHRVSTMEGNVDFFSSNSMVDDAAHELAKKQFNEGSEIIKNVIEDVAVSNPDFSPQAVPNEKTDEAEICPLGEPGGLSEPPVMTTVLYNNPESVLCSIDIVDNASAAEEMVGFASEDPILERDEMTPEDRGKGTATYSKKGSLCKRVKVRVDRKKVFVSPQLNTGEIMEIQEGYTKEEIAQDMQRLKANKKKILDSKILTVKKTGEDVKEEIEFFYVTKGSDHVFFRGVPLMSEVTASHIVSLLHEKRLSSALIDGWADLLHKQYSPIIAAAKYTMIFSSLCWTLIAQSTGGKSSTWLESVIDSRLEEAMDKDTLLFPMMAGGEGSRIGGVGDHWTLLKLNVSKSKWTFYNSRAPRARMQDPHLRESEVVVRYIDMKLREVFKAKRPTNKFRIRPLVLPTSLKCRQQADSSLDCGVVVCSNMEKFMKGKPLETTEMTLNAAAIYRAKMASLFMSE